MLPFLCHTCPAAERPSTSGLQAARWAVPVLCTEARVSGRTKVRGTAVVVDTKGVILTAAHVVLGSGLFCTLTVLVPDNQWSNASKSYAFSVQQCVTEKLLDLAICRIQPVERKQGWAYLRAAKITEQFPKVDSEITITGFWGWGMLPVPRRGQLKTHTLYRRQDGVYCDFSTNVVVFEGMSGSPVVTDEGDLIGIITAAGIKKFSSDSFGISLERAAEFLRAHGLAALPEPH